jgi:hypothetical protein
MAYPIKNTAVSQINSVKTGGFYLGVNQGGYGLTSVTAFWNGKTPNVGGYIVYVGNGTSTPTMYIVADDSQLINLSNTLGGGSNTTIESALNYFINSANSVCVNIDVPNIVTNGLVLYLDAGYTPSYPRGFNTLFDISGGGNNADLVNGMNYSSSYGGQTYMDGGDEYIRIPPSTNLSNYFSTNSFTIETVVTSDSAVYPMSRHPLYINGTVTAATTKGWSVGHTTSDTYLQVRVSDGVNLSVTNIPHNVTQSTAYHRIFTVNRTSGCVTKYYQDGVYMGEDNAPLITGSIYDGVTTDFVTGMVFGYVWGWRFIGGISTIKVYNRVLSTQEIQQNYYASLQKLIPVSFLILWIDAENTNTRVITPTTAYDSSSYDYNGSLMNSMGLSHRNAGTSFSFDGGDDYINLGSPYRIGISVSYLTVSIWFKITTTPVGANTMIKFGAINSGWFIGLTSSGMYYNLYTTTYTYGGGGIGPISLNTWYNVTFTFNGTTFVMYLNGVIVVNTTASAGTIVNGGSTVVNIGRDGSGSGSNYFKGDISIVRVFYDTLTSAQVLNIYNAGKQRHGL